MPQEILLLPTSGVAVTTAASPKRLSALTPREHPRNHNRVTCGGCNRTIDANIRPFVCKDCSTAYHRTYPSLETQSTSLTQATGHALSALPLVNPRPPKLLQAALFRNQNTTNVVKHCGFGSGMQTVRRQNSDSMMTALTSPSSWRKKTTHQPFSGLCTIRAN